MHNPNEHTNPLLMGTIPSSGPFLGTKNLIASRRPVVRWDLMGRMDEHACSSGRAPHASKVAHHYWTEMSQA